MLNIFEVGGCVRDEILGVSTNDIDFTFVIDDTNQTVDEGWEQMLSHLKEAGFKIFLETKECFTVRAKFPKNHINEGLNALAKDMDGNIIDHFNGLKHLKEGILITPLDPRKTMIDDPLRVLRALRFSITKGFEISEDIMDSMKQPDILEKLKTTVSQERIREELTKMMKFDTIKSMKLLVDIDKNFIHGFLDIVFENNMWLNPTTKNK
jgi:tRNA nucleotidyltransferase/poly(A) polymerase